MKNITTTKAYLTRAEYNELCGAEDAIGALIKAANDPAVVNQVDLRVTQCLEHAIIKLSQARGYIDVEPQS